MITYHIDKSVTKSNTGTFSHLVLSDIEHVEGYKLGIDSWADTCCVGKHAFVEEFIENKTVTAAVFTPSLGLVSNISIENVVYTYDAPDRTVLLLECNNSIYIGQKISDSLLNPIQAEEVGIYVDTWPRRYYPNDVECQSLHLPNVTIINVLYEGVLPYIPICPPTKEEFHHCWQFEMNSWIPWDPFLLNG